jgi:DNA (cytosine-5)-methyltransferase 1
MDNFSFHTNIKKHNNSRGIQPVKGVKPTYTFIDLFAGAGGLSEGFLRNGYIPVAHIEKNKDACFTLKTRLAYHYLKNSGNIAVYQDYILGKIDRTTLYKNVPPELISSVMNSAISEENIDEIFVKISESLKTAKRKKVDVIVGGPPCQAYSLLGRAATKDKIGDDHRNYLYKLYGKFLTRFQPKLFVFENVPGIRTANDGKYYKNLKKYFKRIGYEVEDQILDAVNFGVVQRRQRVIIIGWKKKLNFEYPAFKAIKNIWTVKDLFSDLPNIEPGESNGIFKYKKKINDYLNRFEIRNGTDTITQHITRPHNRKDLRIYRLAIQAWEDKGKRLKNRDIPDKVRTQSNVTSFLDRFKVVAGDQVSHTMIAHIAKDGHHYIHPDKKQLRSISVREAARIQSFPDDYFFEGPRTSIFRQVGNAVPPLMADKIAKKILEKMP